MEKLDGKTFDIVSDNIKKLEELFPEIVTEGKVDVDKLALLFDKTRNEDTDASKDGEERYEFTWKGKKEAIRMAQKQTTGTLRPCREESVNFDETQNLYIEGDNLEVLRALQSSYRGKIKMIYIDPPYNTGKDFVYKDNFDDNIKNYKERMNESYKTNIDSSGRFHTNWLNMMYPRLKLSKNLLSEDGVIFISLDDNEISNLRKMCDEVFGEKNFVSILPTVMNMKGNNDQFGFSGTHEYTLVYMKNKNVVEDLNGIDLTEEDKKDYTLSDERGLYKQGATLMRTGEAGGRDKRPKGYYPIYVSKDLKMMSVNKMNADDYEVYPKTKDGKEMSWRRSKENLSNTVSEFIIKENNGNISFYKKQRLEEDMARGKKAKTLFYKPEYSSGNGTSIIKDLLNGRLFDNPKPLALVKDFLRIGLNKDDIVLDFFSGSATTSHAVMQLNAEDGGNRKFIMVQLPEETDEKSEAYKNGYKNICEIGKERIRRAGKKILEENKDKEGIEDLDIGFKVFKLDTTNIKEWDDTVQDTEKIKQMAMDLENPIKEDRSPEDIVYEILLKYGIDLTMPIEEVEIMGYKVYSVGFGYLMICLEKDINLDLIESIADKKPNRVVLYDKGLENEIKVNAMKIFKEYGVEDIRTI